MPTPPQVRDWYVESFRELRAFPPIKDMEMEGKFTELITRIMARHNNVVPMIAAGVFSLREELDAQVRTSVTQLTCEDLIPVICLVNPMRKRGGRIRPRDAL